MFRRGFKYGMILQFAIGPVSLLVFKTAGTAGFVMGLVVVLAAALVDAAFIAIAGAGAILFLTKDKVQVAARIISGIVLILFGVITILGVFNISVFSGIQFFSEMKTQNVFLQGILLTASNPMTILFWNSLITSQAQRHKMNRRQLFLFGSGCVLSTVIFLTATAGIGSVADQYLPAVVTLILNVLIGLVLIGYGVYTMNKKKSSLSVNNVKNEVTGEVVPQESESVPS